MLQILDRRCGASDRRRQLDCDLGGWDRLSDASTEEAIGPCGLVLGEQRLDLGSECRIITASTIEESAQDLALELERIGHDLSHALGTGRRR